MNTATKVFIPRCSHSKCSDPFTGPFYQPYRDRAPDTATCGHCLCARCVVLDEEEEQNSEESGSEPIRRVSCCPSCNFVPDFIRFPDFKPPAEIDREDFNTPLNFSRESCAVCGERPSSLFVLTIPISDKVDQIDLSVEGNENGVESRRKKKKGEPDGFIVCCPHAVCPACISVIPPKERAFHACSCPVTGCGMLGNSFLCVFCQWECVGCKRTFKGSGHQTFVASCPYPDCKHVLCADCKANHIQMVCKTVHTHSERGICMHENHHYDEDPRKRRSGRSSASFDTSRNTVIKCSECAKTYCLKHYLRAGRCMQSEIKKGCLSTVFVCHSCADDEESDIASDPSETSTDEEPVFDQLSDVVDTDNEELEEEDEDVLERRSRIRAGNPEALESESADSDWEDEESNEEEGGGEEDEGSDGFGSSDDGGGAFSDE